MPLDHSRTAIVFAHRSGNRSRRAKLDKTTFVLEGTRLGAKAAAAGGSTEKAASSKLGGVQKARVTVRRARERDYQGVAEIRGVIIPVGMSGATGFLGGKVVIDDPAEAERRLLMAKVCLNALEKIICMTPQRDRRSVCYGNLLILLSPTPGPVSHGGRSQHAPTRTLTLFLPLVDGR